MRRISALLSFSLIACTSAGDGIAPPLDAVYFPTGLALSKDSRFLYVINSDFDLQYNAGTVISLDAERIRSLVPRGCAKDSDCPDSSYCDVSNDPTDPKDHSHWCLEKTGPTANMPCGGLGTRSSNDEVTVPGRCQAVSLTQPPDGLGSLIADAVEIGAFATDAIIRSAPSTAQTVERIFVPVRGDSTVDWIDLSEEGKFDCGQGNGRSCDERHRAGRDASSNSRALVLPSEPFGIDATDDASAIVVTHQTQGAISLLLNDWQVGPHLEYVYAGLPPMPIAVKAVPQPLVVTSGSYDAAPGFLVAYETTASMDLFRYAADERSTPGRPYLERTASAAITVNSGGYDVRGIAIDDLDRRKCEQTAKASNDDCLLQCPLVGEPQQPECSASCSSDNTARLLECANVPLNIFAASRSPASLLVGRTTANSALSPNSEVPYFGNALPLPTGPSRIQIARIINANGEVETRVLVVCFDSRRIAVFDPTRGNIETWITTGRGPQAIVEDFQEPSATNEGHALLLVGHFTDSYLGVVELDRRRGRAYGSIILSLGTAVAPRTSK